MQDITEAVSQYREAARHLWNTAFRAEPVSWDARDRFSRVASELFTALVLNPAGVTDERLPDMFEANPSHLQRIAVIPASERVPILVNRASASRGYWDDPMTALTQGEAEVRFVGFFDWDELGHRDFQYVQVRIVDWASHPEVVGRSALIEFRYVRLHVLARAAA